LPVVPMFHANAWGYPYVAAMLGAKLVFPGPHLDPRSLLEDFEHERVTVSAGVPTIWMGILQLLDADPDAFAISSLRALLAGGAALDDRGLPRAPRAHGLPRLGHARALARRRRLRRPSRPRGRRGDPVRLPGEAGPAAAVRRGPRPRRRGRRGAVGRRHDGR